VHFFKVVNSGTTVGSRNRSDAPGEILLLSIARAGVVGVLMNRMRVEVEHVFLPGGECVWQEEGDVCCRVLKIKTRKVSKMREVKEEERMVWRQGGGIPGVEGWKVGS